MLDIPSISAVVAAVGVIVGVVFTYSEVRNLVKQRRTDLVMRLYSTFTSKEFNEALLTAMSMEFTDYNDFVKKYGPPLPQPNQSTNRSAHLALFMVASFFEGAGHLVYRKLLDIDLAYELLPTIPVWNKMKPMIEGWRKQYNEPRFMSGLNASAMNSRNESRDYNKHNNNPLTHQTSNLLSLISVFLSILEFYSCIFDSHPRTYKDNIVPQKAKQR